VPTGRTSFDRGGAPSARRQRGFSFPELLVVIGLIVLLIGILLPAIAGARRQAAIVKCSSNLHQIATASLLHAHDMKGYLPLVGEVAADTWPDQIDSVPIGLNDPYRRRYTYGGGNGSMFFVVPVPAALARYFGINYLPFDDVYKLDMALNDNRGAWKMFMCPETNALTKNRVSTNPADTTPEGQGLLMVVSFHGSFLYAWSTNSDYAFNEGLMGYNCDPQYSSRRLAGNLAAVRRSSEMVLVTDAKRRGFSNIFWVSDPWICWTPNLNSTGAVTLASALRNDGRAQDKTSFDLSRHRGRMNVAFVDGHVELMRIKAPDLDRAYLLTR